ncbi:MAG TPA: J domain-containing protein, partial [Myxococcota bacterium]|nr:J domain-containing protein [Myxococcota bacterium]
MRVGDTLGNAHAQVLALAPGVVATALSLDPAAGYVLSRIDGRTTWGTLRQIGALPPHEVDRLVESWLKDGVLVASGKAIQSSRDTRAGDASEQQEKKPAAAQAKPAAPPPPRPAAAKPKAPSLPELDASLDLDVELQREILAFAVGLGRRYHELLGVAADADARTVKKAYFALSKKLHPDRYFRRNTGPFGALIETCFKRLLEAYELLSDPTTRKEVQAAEAAAPPPPAPTMIDAADAAGARARGLEARRRLRERVSAMSSRARAAAERRRKAKTFFEHGMT